MEKYFIIKSTYRDEEGKMKNIYYYVSLKMMIIMNIY